VYARTVDPSGLAHSLSSHRHSDICHYESSKRELNTRLIEIIVNLVPGIYESSKRELNTRLIEIIVNLVAVYL
jgi:hypothetical protein